jgi:uncharacterized protein (DUF302 family)
MRLSRYWMTGCMALVLLVAGRSLPGPDLRSSEREESDQERKGWVVSLSNRPLDETVRLLQQAARSHGLAVLADFTPGAIAGQVAGQLGGEAAGGPSGLERVLVLGRSDGHTPVLQLVGDANQTLAQQSGGQAGPQATAASARHAGWELPLKLLVQTLPDGSTRVVYGDHTRFDALGGLPSELQKHLASLPSIVTAALAKAQPARTA